MAQQNVLSYTGEFVRQEKTSKGRRPKGTKKSVKGTSSKLIYRGEIRKVKGQEGKTYRTRLV